MTSRVTAPTLSSQRKSLLKKHFQRDVSSVGDRLSDDETHRRQPNYSFLDKDRPRRFSNVNELRRTNNQLGILREILSSARDIDKFIAKNPRLSASTGSKPKKLLMNGNTRPTSAKSVTLCDQDDSSGPSDHSPVRTTSRARSSSNNRSNHNVSFISDDSNRQQLKKLLDLLWIELDDLERLTGVRKGEKSSTNTCSSALAVALLHLTGHVKECLRTNQNKQEMKTLKDQLAIVIRNQLDFQQKIENQMCTLQTMMQTICQLVNSEIISHRNQIVTAPVVPPPAPDRYSYHASKVPVVPNTAMDELLTFAQRMNDDISRPTTRRPMSAISNSETQSYETVKPIVVNRRTVEPESTRLSPVENRSTYDLFDTTTSTKETLLEKILQERLRLVQHMAELNEHTADLPSSSN